LTTFWFFFFLVGLVRKYRTRQFWVIFEKPSEKTDKKSSRGKTGEKPRKKKAERKNQKEVKTK